MLKNRESKEPSKVLLDWPLKWIQSIQLQLNG